MLTYYIYLKSINNLTHNSCKLVKINSTISIGISSIEYLLHLLVYFLFIQVAMFTKYRKYLITIYITISIFIHHDKYFL